MPVPNGSALTMFDSVNVGQIPAEAVAVAGYVNGRYPTVGELATKFPSAHHLTIDVFGSRPDAMCLDVENGDATNSTAVTWAKAKMARKEKPAIYTSVSNAATLLRALGDAGIKRSQITLWTAHYTFRPHLCSHACGYGMPGVADATQWTDKYLGRTLDASLVGATFFGPLPTPAPTPAPVPVATPQQGEAKNEAPFTNPVWPVPLPQWFWHWAQWRVDGETYERPWDTPPEIPDWAWARLKALEGGQ